MSDWCDDWLKVGRITFETRIVSELCGDWLQAGQYKV